MNLQSVESSYLLASAQNLDALISYLCSMGFSFVEIQGYYGEKFEKSVMAFPEEGYDKNSLRTDCLRIIEFFHQECVIVKYRGDSSPVKILASGDEKPMDVVMYNTDDRNVSYLHNGVSFSFVDSMRYVFPSRREELKSGMVVEMMSGDKWIKKIVSDVDVEYRDTYQLFMKHGKLRVAY